MTFPQTERPITKLDAETVWLTYLGVVCRSGVFSPHFVWFRLSPRKPDLLTNNLARANNVKQLPLKAGGYDPGDD